MAEAEGRVERARRARASLAKTHTHTHTLGKLEHQPLNIPHLALFLARTTRCRTSSGRKLFAEALVVQTWLWPEAPTID